MPMNLLDGKATAEINQTEETPLVIGIAQWRQDSGSFIDVQERAYATLNNQISQAELSNVTLEKLPVYLDNAMQVDDVAAEYAVDMILWGWYDPTAIRSYVDLANATQDDGLTNSLAAFLEHGGSTQAVRVLILLSTLDYDLNGLYFCVPRWTP
ncbi:MAG: hypothetical protein ABFS17_08740 [Chloroflexota bacterium]